VLSLRDTNSLHGTFRRPRNEPTDTRLKKGEKVLLEDGDEIRFGIDIYRSHETFPPCVVDFGVRWNPSNQTYGSLSLSVDVSVPLTLLNSSTTQPTQVRSCSTNRFVVPDDEDEDWQTDEDKSVVEIDKPSPRLIVHSSKVSIDLTGTPGPQLFGIHDASPVPYGVTTGRVVTSGAIDLTSEPSPPGFQDYSSDDASDNEDADADADADDDGSEMDEDHYSPASPELASLPPVAEEETSVASYRLSSVDHQTDEEDSDIEDEHMCDSCHDSDSHVDGQSDYPEESSDDESVTRCIYPCVDMEDENATDDFDGEDDFAGEDQDCKYKFVHCSPFLLSFYLPRRANTKRADMSNEHEFNDRPVSLNNAEAVQRQSDQVEEQNSTLAQFGESLALSTAFDVHPNPGQVMYSDTVYAGPAEVCTAPAPSEPNTKFPLFPLVEYEQLEPPLPATSCGNRLPSPSDAALAKSHLTPPKTPAVSSMAQSLGERTGKYDFFAAREQNRAAVMANPLITIGRTTDASMEPAGKATETPIQTESGATTAAASEEDTTTSEVSLEEQSEPKLLSDDQDNELWLPHVMDAPFLIPTAWTSSGEAFLKEPHHCPVPSLCDGHLDQDMISAATYVESKKRSESKSNRTIRRVRIQELLAQESNEGEIAALAQLPVSKAPPDSVLPAGTTTLPVPCTPARPAKRSFSEVFTESEAEPSQPSPAAVPARESSLAHAADSEISKAPASGTGEDDIPKTEISGNTSSGPGLSSSSVATPTLQSDARPAKRRRFAQIAACAFGGIMGGAAVLAGMIATAPIESVMNSV
jgi:hypothetical protein